MYDNDTRAEDKLNTYVGMLLVSSGSEMMKYMVVVMTKIEPQSRILRQTLIQIRVNWRRGSLVENLMLVGASSNFGSCLAP